MPVINKVFRTCAGGSKAGCRAPIGRLPADESATSAPSQRSATGRRLNAPRCSICGWLPINSQIEARFVQNNGGSCTHVLWINLFVYSCFQGVHNEYSKVIQKGMPTPAQLCVSASKQFLLSRRLAEAGPRFCCNSDNESKACFLLFC